MKNIISFICTTVIAAVSLCSCSDNNTSFEPLSSAYEAETTTVTTAVTAKPATTVKTTAEAAVTETVQTTAAETAVSAVSLLSSPGDIALTDTDGLGQNYTFTYGEETFRALYEPDNWHIYNSCMIEDHNDIVLICQALITEHPIHGADMQSMRTAEDMAYEWEQHNIAYYLLPESSRWKEDTRDVDLDAKDQGKSLLELFMDRVG